MKVFHYFEVIKLSECTFDHINTELMHKHCMREIKSVPIPACTMSGCVCWSFSIQLHVNRSEREVFIIVTVRLERGWIWGTIGCISINRSEK